MNILTNFPVFLLVLVRVMSFFLTVPIFSYRTIPASLKIGLGVFLSYILVFTVDANNTVLNELFVFLIIKEAIVGISIGLIAYIILSAIQIAGGFIDFQMGFAIANVIDPQTGAQSPILGQYLYVFSLLFLLSTNGHHLLIDGIFYSYQFIPVDQLALSFGQENMVDMIVKTFAGMFAIAFQMALPIVGSIFLVDIALGIIARTVPQLNVFVVGLPIKIFVSFILLFLIMGTILYAVSNLFELIIVSMRDFMHLLGAVN